MASSQQNVELEAAKFLQKLIHDSKDEPLKLATKLYVILQHMKSSGKENSMPYQVISRAMETVIHQNGIDIEALKSARPPLNSQNQSGDSSAQYAGPSQVGPSKDSTSLLVENDVAKTDVHASSRPPVGPNSGMHDTYQGSMSHRSGKSLDHSSPSSLDCKSANSQSQDQMANQKDCKKGNSKRKRTDSPLAEPNADTSQQYDLRSAVPHSRIGNQSNKGASSKFQDSNPGFAGSYPVMESGFLSPMQGSSSSYENHGFSLKNSNERGRDAFSSVSSVPVELSSGGLEHGDVISNVAADGSKIVQGGGPNLLDSNMYRHTASRDSGRSIVQRSTSSGMPFKEHHLKQLRAQCLVFLAFRNGLMPKKLHLEIALGNIFPKEGGKSDGFGKELSGRGTDRSGHQASSSGNIINADNMQLDATSTKLENKDTLSSDMCMTNEEAIHHMDFKRYPSPEMNSAFMSTKPDFSTIGGRGVSGLASSSLGTTHQMKSDMMNWTEAVGPNDASRGFAPASGVHSEMGSERVDNVPTQLHSIIDSSLHPNHQFNSCISNLSLRDNWKFVHGGEMDNQQAMPLRLQSVLPPQVLLGGKTIPVHDSTSIASVRLMEGSSEQQDGKSLRATLSPSKYATSDKWIVEHQKRKFQHDQKQLMKQNKTDKKIAACFHKLKETVSSSEDISAKTKSVIELKKLQLLELQRRLRSDFLKDFHKPVAADMDRLRSMKKYRHGRRIKQLEKYELKMKEERQKRIKERQKEFFTEIELHKERLEETFKLKRERWRNFNKYAKEFHRRKERIHRERIDRIQREKINLLKINDVEGYLRMVKDAKSDRVKQLLKETEKYLQKLGAKLKEAKDVSRSLESNTDENRAMCIVDDIALENVDDSDQAKHYLESNEKYYLMAHSIKESISEQPISLHGGKLREYQMNGLRWLVSLYNNHLNGILADEMGLGKTVQVIALLCYLMETKNDRGPFLVVVPSSVLPGWDSELNLWARGINKVVYSGPAEERRRLFKEVIIQQKFNVLLTTYEYLMNKHDRPKLSKVQWRYIIIDEGHRIKNASCKLNADLKHYRSSHRLLLTGTPLQNNLEELWALLNFLLPNIFNSSEDFSQWFNKPFESTGDDSPDEALLSEEENLLIINRLHQVLRPFVLRRLKHKVENELPEKIERLVRCEASAYQKILMKRVEDNLGSLGTAKGRSVHNSVMELRNICNHPYLSHLHTEEIEDYVPKHYLPSIVRLCGKLEMLDRLLPKLLATGHRILFFSTMTRLLDVMEDYLHWKQYKYLRLDGHTSGGDRGALIDRFNIPNSPYFIFLLSIRAGGVGVNLQAADTVIIFDTDWNPQVDLQAQARAHRIGQKKDVLVLRFETVNTVEEQVRASAEHKLGVANQSITAGFFDNNTSAEDRREYLESLLRECKKEEDTSVLDDDALNDLLARSESEIDVFESVDKLRRDGEMDAWRKLMSGRGTDVPPLSSRLVTDDELKPFCEAMKKYEVKSTGETSQNGIKRKGGARGLDTQHYGRGKRAREVRSYEEQWTEEEFEQLCQADNAESPNVTEDLADLKAVSDSVGSISAEFHSETLSPTQPTPPKSVPESQKVEVTPPSRRGRGRPKKTTSGSGSTLAHGSAKLGAGFPHSVTPRVAALFSSPDQVDGATPASSRSSLTCPIPASVLDSTPFGPVRSPKKTQSRVEVLCHEEKKTHIPSSVVDGADAQDLKTSVGSVVGLVNSTGLHTAAIPPIGCALPVLSGNAQQAGLSIASNYPTSMDPLAQSSVPLQAGVQNQKKTVEASRRRGIKRAAVPLSDFNALVDYEQKSDEPSPEISDDLFGPHSGNTSDPSSNGFPTTATGIDASGQNLGVVHHTRTSPHVLSVAIASQATSLMESSPLRSGRGRGRGRSQKSQRVTDGVGRRRGRRASVTLAVNVVGSASDQGIHADEHMNSESSIEQTIKQQEENSQKHAESSVDVSLESPKNNEADGLSNLQDKSVPKVIAAPHTLVDPAVGSTASTFLVDLVQNTKDVTSELFLSDEATLLDGSASSVPAGQLSYRKSDTSLPTIKLVPGNIDDQEEAPPGFDHPIHKPINQPGDKNDTVATSAMEPPQAKVLVSQYVVGELNIQKDMVGELNMQQATGTDEDKSDSIKVFEVNLELSGTTSDDVLSCRTEGNSSDKLSVSLASNLKFDSSGAMENDSTSAEEHGSVRSVITHCSITGDNVGDTLQAVVPILLPRDQADNSGLINLSADDSLSRAIDAAQDTQNSKDITAHTIILTEANQMSVEDPVIRDNVIAQMVSSPDHASSVDGKSVNMACLIELYVPSEGDINEGPILKVIEDSRSEPTVEVHSDVDELLDVGQSSGLSTIKQMSPGVENHPKTSKSASVSSDLSAVFDVDKNVIDDKKSGLEIVPEWHETELPECGGTDKTQGDEVHNLEMKLTKKEATSAGIVSNEQLPESCETVNTSNTSHEGNILKMPLEDTLLPHPLEPVEVMDIKKLSDTDQLANQFTVGQPDDSQIDVATGVVTDLPDPTAESDASDNSMLRLSLVESTECNNENGLESVEGKLKATSEDPLSTESPSRAFMHGSEGDHFCADISRNHAGVQMFAEVQNTDVSEVSNAEMQLSEVPSSSSGVDLKKDDVTGNCFIAQMPIIEMKPAEDPSLSSPNVKSSTCDVLGGSSSVRDLVGVENSNDGKVVPVEKEQLEVQASSALDAYSSKDDVPTMVAECSDCSNHDTLLDQSSVIETDALQDTVMVEGKMTRELVGEVDSVAASQQIVESDLDRGEIPCQQSHTQGMTMEGSLLISVEIGSPSALERFEKPRTAHNYGMMIDDSSPLVGSLGALDGAEKTNSTLEERSQKPEVEGMTKEGPVEQDVILTEPTQSEMLELSPECTNEMNAPQRMIIEPSVELSMSTTSIFEQTETLEITMQIEAGEHINYSGRMVNEGATAEGSIRQNGELVEQSQVKMPEVTKETIEQPRNAEVLAAEGNSIDQPELESTVMEKRSELATVTGVVTTIEPTRVTADPAVLKLTETTRNEELEKLEVVEPVRNPALMGLQENLETIQNEKMPEATQKMERSGTPLEEIIEQPRNAEVLTTEGNITDQLESEIPLMASIEQPMVTDVTTTVEPSQPTGDPVVLSPMERTETIQKEEVEQLEVVASSESVGNYGLMRLQRNPGTIQHEENDQLEERKPSESVCNELQEKPETIKQDTTEQQEATETSESVGKPFDVEMVEKPDMIEQDKIEQLEETEGKEHISMVISEGIVTVQEIGELLRPSESELPGSSELVGSPATVEPQYESEAMQVETIEEDALKVQITTVSAEQAKPSIAMECLEISQTTRDESNKESHVVELDPPKSSVETVESPPTVEPMQLGTIENLDEDAITAPMTEGCAAQVSQIDVIPQSVEHGGSLAALELLGGYDTDQEESIEVNEAEPAIDSPFGLVGEKEAISDSAEEKAAREPKCSDALVPKSMEDEAATVDDPLENTDLEPKATP